jgi:hypothetical protein
MRASAVVIRIFALTLLSTASFAQEYPRWFLDQGDLPCAGAAVGITATPYYPDSTGGQGLLLAAENAVRYRAMTISGTMAYFTSEGGGTCVVSSTVTESFDTALVENAAKSMKLLTSYSSLGLTLVLAGPSGCDVPGQFMRMVRVGRSNTPSWVTELPPDQKISYAVGISEPFYYEESSWTEAEKNARLELARMAHSRMRGVDYLQRNDSGVSSGSAIRDEDLGSTTLRGVRVLHRWRNPANSLFYVLMGTPR